jgi:hypothetical protein
MGGLSMGDRRIIGITGLGIVRRRQGIVRMGRTSRVIVRHRIMVGGVRRILEMVGGHRGMETEAGIDRRGMEPGPDRLEMAEILGMGEGLDHLETATAAGIDRRVMELGLGHPEMGEILGMGEGLDHLATEVGLGRLGMVEVAGPQRLLLSLLLRLGLHLHLRLVQLQVVLLREDLIQGINRVARSRRNGLSHRLVRVRVDLAGITMALRRSRPVIAAKPALVAVGVQEVNRNENYQA